MAENLNSLAASIADTKQLYGKKVTDAQDFLDYAQRNSININLWDEGYDGIADANNVTSQRMFAKDSMLFLELKGANGQDGQMVCIDLSASTLTPTVVSEQDIENMFIEKNGLSGILNINDAIEDVDIGKNDLINPKINLNKINLDNASGLTAADELITTLISKGFVDKTSYSSALNSIKSIFGNHSESSIISENETTGIIEIKVVRDGEAFVATYDTKNSDDPVSVKQLSINDFAVDGKIEGIDKSYFKETSFSITNGKLSLEIDPSKIDLTKTEDTANIIKYEAGKGTSAADLQTLLGSNNITVTKAANGNYTVKINRDGKNFNFDYDKAQNKVNQSISNSNDKFKITKGDLSQISAAEMSKVQGVDLSAKLADGTPMYIIAKGQSDGLFHIYKYLQPYPGNQVQYLNVLGANKVKQGSNYLYASNANMTTIKSLTTNIDNSYYPIGLPAGFSTGSPLILDTDHDGKVEATQGQGVDIDESGTADGAATGGDKMLAMGDINGDGKITGSEVFGNETVDPFTGEKLNAANGFEALRMVAESAERHTGINCIGNGQVDVQKLKFALEQAKVGSLGLISDDNISKLEGLGDIAKINVADFTEQDEQGDVQHRQLGSFTDTDGKTSEVDDVWFTLNNPDALPKDKDSLFGQ